MDSYPEISIVIPLFNEEGNLTELHEKLKLYFSKQAFTSEIIFVDDGSSDRSLEIIRNLSEKDDTVKCISLSRNFGHQVALTAGLQYASGDATITMDADLQHPPEVIDELYNKWQEGYDIVNTKRIDHESISTFKKKSSGLFYRLMNFMSDVPIEPASSDFRLMSRRCVDAFLQIHERDRFTRGLVSWMGYRQAIVSYIASPRFNGKTKYSLKKMIDLGLNGITAFSAKPLRISFFLGLIIFTFGIIYSIYAVVSFFMNRTIPGWASLLVSILILSGIQLLSIGIVGEYISRIFNEAKSRPLFFVKDRIGDFENDTTKKNKCNTQ